MKPTPYNLRFIQEATAKDVPAIAPELLAAKMQAMRQLREPALVEQCRKYPRLPELLWFLQARSFAPGGLLSFVREMLTRFPERIGTRDMVETGYPKGGIYSLEQCLA